MFRNDPQDLCSPTARRVAPYSPNSDWALGPNSPTTLPGPMHRVPGPDASRPSDDSNPAGASVLPGALFQQPHSVLVFGPSRPLVRLTLFAFASAANPGFHWVEFSSPNAERTPCDPVRLGWIPDGRLWLIDPPHSMQPDDTSATLPISKLISGDEPADSRSRFAEFLRLPELSQRIIASQVPDGHPGVVAVTEARQVTAAFPSERVPSILNLHQELGISVMVGHDSLPGPGRDLFEFVFHLRGEGERLEDWKQYQLVCEKGIVSGPLRDRRPVLVGEIPFLAEVLARARPSEA